MVARRSVRRSRTAARRPGARCALEPRLELLPTPAVEVAFGERQRLADAESGPPEQYHECTRAQAVRRRAGAPHDRDDLLGGGRIGGVVAGLVPRRSSAVVAGHCRWRAATASSVEKDGIAHAVKPPALPLCPPFQAHVAAATLLSMSGPVGPWAVQFRRVVKTRVDLMPLREILRALATPGGLE